MLTSCVGKERMPRASVAVGASVGVASLVAVGGGGVLVGTLVGNGASGVHAAKIANTRIAAMVMSFFTALASADVVNHSLFYTGLQFT